MTRRIGAAVLALLGASALALTAAVPAASAATTSSWATWPTFSGASGSYQGTMTLAGQPALTAALTSDSVGGGGGGVGVISGASTWLAASTPVGAKYGSSRDQPYLNLRPKANNAASPSTTTYSFATPTPPSGWTFVLGDIDADQVTVTAIGPDGTALTPDELGFNGGFNYCAPGLAGKPSCTGSATDVPTWDPATQVLRGNDAAQDTAGAAGWFEPSAPISSLTFTFQQRLGAPVYQAWFASLARDVTGTVTDQTTGPLDGVGVRLIDRDGRVVASTTTAGGGAYAFAGYFATDGYTVQLVPPTGKIVDGPSRAAADLTDEDAVADFTVRDIVPVAVSGTALDTDGVPIVGATVTIDGVGSVTTDTDGNYLFDTVPVGDHTVVITPPAGYAVQTAPAPFTVPVGSETPITEQDFVLVANPSLGGVITSGGVGVAGVTVSVDGPNGVESAVTAADGSYRFPLLPAGAYQVSIVAPEGYVVSGAATREEELADADLDAVDFELARLGTVIGDVRTDTDAPVPAATVTVTTPGGPVALTTTAEGSYGLADLAPGSYEVTLTVPAGYSVPAGGATTATVVVGTDGAVQTVPTFVLVADAVLGGLAGTVETDTGAPIADVTVTVETPAGPVDVTTDVDGAYDLDGLAPGSYEVSVAVPEGYTAEGATTATVVVAAGGSVVSVSAFVLVPDAVVPVPSTNPSDPAVPGNAGRLPSTGADAMPWIVAAGALFVLGAAGVVTAAVLRRRRANRDELSGE
ncbi:carboxypeptidase regulatory-like domain-containing protein [Plantibacter sp. VKM Ac-2876]|uniref:carboxypeptidase regulatory-like domain-containing protein n=1 Tax=Plantibacter sp. VKM Ac-2876 TaxID=2783826 RepID=UPI00188B3AD4|nr:carboxypeptidase regulatory-like domain-containing protein [Plantibacter sp. VKM Ac-2876]MBF4566242.1 carboxypeptidase regulatory-like domain-containing protein [Plantibacter sp. VKM Ac-2876]